MHGLMRGGRRFNLRTGAESGEASGPAVSSSTAEKRRWKIQQENSLQEGDCVATKSVATKSVTAKGIGGKTAGAKAVAAKSPAKKVKELRELSEQDLLKAPDKEYMNEAQLAFFKQRLLELRTQLLTNADDTGQHLRENEVTTDPSDRATLEEEYTLELRTRDRERKLLKKVEKSLKMIDDGSYGYCEETGEPIGVPRLLARPTATLSLEAQERRERVQRLYGD
jgi:DnaK suppressor protein